MCILQNFEQKVCVSLIVLMFKFYVGVFPTRITLFPHSSTNFIIFAL